MIVGRWQEPLPGLHDIAVPDPVSWAPQTIGWLVALLLVVALSAWALVRIRRRKAANRYREVALSELVEIERALAEPEGRAVALSRVPILLKRVALSFGDRQQVASLTGDDWLAYLDTAYGGVGFRQGPGKVLPALAYDPAGIESLDEDALADLMSLSRKWIRRHDGRRVNRAGDRV